MAGMLPGVECARRRRLHHQSRRDSDPHGVPAHNWTRHPAICLYTSNRELHHSPPSNKDGDSIAIQKYVDEDLDAAAKEAKERLDKKFNIQTNSHGRNRHNGQEELRFVDGRTVAVPVFREMRLHDELHTTKKGSNMSKKMFTWIKLVRYSHPCQI